MATYVSLINYTDQGIKTIKNSPNRLDAVRKMIGDMGGELKDFYLTLGAYDLVVVVEAPDDETGAKIFLAIGAAGNVRTTTLKAFSEDEYRRIIAAIP